MTIPILGDIIREVGATAREFIPDADKKLELDLKFAELADKAEARENELLMGQIEINKIEAQSSNIFISGWRPAIGWIGAAALGYTWIVSPLLKAIFALSVLPALPASDIYPIIMALLGLGGLRTWEKMRGVTASAGNVVHTPMLPSKPPSDIWRRNR